MHLVLLDHLARHGLAAQSPASRIPKHQIFLLGGNPLPIRVALEALSPSHVLCVTTDAAGGEAEGALRRWCEVRGIDWRVKHVVRAGHATDTERALNEAVAETGWLRDDVPVGLHYSGGTKAMATAARLWWHVRFDTDPAWSVRHRCSYLDPKEGMVFEGVSAPCSVRQVAIDLDELTGLHDMRIKRSVPDAEADGLAMAIGLKLFGEGHAADAFLATLPPIHGVRVDVTFGGAAGAGGVRVVAAGQADPFVGSPGKTLRLDGAASTHASNLGSGALADWPVDALALFLERPDLIGKSINDLLPSVKKGDRLKWLSGLWFETWLRERIHTSPGMSWQDCLHSVKIGRGSGTEGPEVDLVLRRGHEVLLVSVTMSSESHVSRAKAHMARTQATALGGDHCRYLLATWIQKEDVLTTIARELAQHWQGPDRFRVLGYSHYGGGCAVTHLAKGQPVRESLDDMLTRWFA
jgi:hypothetical protein